MVYPFTSCVRSIYEIPGRGAREEVMSLVLCSVSKSTRSSDVKQFDCGETHNIPITVSQTFILS